MAFKRRLTDNNQIVYNLLDETDEVIVIDSDEESVLKSAQDEKRKLLNETGNTNFSSSNSQNATVDARETIGNAGYVLPSLLTETRSTNFLSSANAQNATADASACFSETIENAGFVLPSYKILREEIAKSVNTIRQAERAISGEMEAFVAMRLELEGKTKLAKSAILKRNCSRMLKNRLLKELQRISFISPPRFVRRGFQFDGSHKRYNFGCRSQYQQY